MRERARGTPGGRGPKGRGPSSATAGSASASAASDEQKSRDRELADNRRAFYDYAIEDRLEAGVALTGTEIKSLRAGHVNLRDGFVRIEDGEAWLRGVHISPWTHTGFDNHEPLRSRKLLLH